jgi:hypothetical protein
MWRHVRHGVVSQYYMSAYLHIPGHDAVTLAGARGCGVVQDRLRVIPQAVAEADAPTVVADKSFRLANKYDLKVGRSRVCIQLGGPPRRSAITLASHTNGGLDRCAFT